MNSMGSLPWRSAFSLKWKDNAPSKANRDRPGWLERA